MTMLLKGSEFLKAWKKAKPLMLTDTGISDMLRKLPDDANPSDIKQFKKAAADLTAKMNDPKIKAEKKALACLTEIQNCIRDELVFLKRNRATASKILEDIHGFAVTYHKEVEKGQLTPAKVGAFSPRNGTLSGLARKMDMITSRGRDGLTVPPEIIANFQGQLDKMYARSKLMLELAEDAASTKPKLDMKTKYPPIWRSFGECMQKLPPIWKQLDALES